MSDQRQYPSLGAEFRVRRHRPVRNAILTAVILAVAGIGGWWLYDMGVRDGGYREREVRATESHLRLQVDELRGRVAELTEENTLLERSHRIDEDAIGRLREALAEREERIAGLEEELAFYRNLVSPSEMQAGLRIRRLSLAAVPGEERTYRYELVLTQLNSDDTYVEGRVDFELEGRQPDDGRRTLKLDEVATGDGEADSRFRFRYFQTLRGRIRLPESFDPIRVQLRVEPSGGRVDPVEEDYPWSSLLSGGP
ncbi:MAG: DUF6776 family protein [Halofilum sp. (in: g-proteobacteria)]